MRRIRITRTPRIPSTRRTEFTTGPVDPVLDRKKTSGAGETFRRALPDDLDLRSPSGRPLPY
ncbi:hypothetical protein ACFHYQ_04075 [Sphaerimonospora cavernae]|uniref:Uncharacterized protein n=1 Tax=Sphaerimonospora cavernae TaxID=1740611 RepID=A0ABV6TZ44_9ACTN